MPPEDDAQPGRTEEKASAQTEEEKRYTADELTERARSTFGVSPHLVAGALAGETRQSWTVAQAQKKVDAFAKREVETDAPEGQYPEPEGAEAA